MDDLAERFKKVIEFGNKADKQSLNLLIQSLLHDPSPIVRHECAFHLGRTSNPDAAPFLRKAVEDDPSSFVIHEALVALGEVGNSSYIPFVERYLTSTVLEIRESAEIALAYLRNRN